MRHNGKKRAKPKSQKKLVLREDRDRPSQHGGRCKGWRSNWLMRKTDRERQLRHVGGGLYQHGAALSGDPGSDLTALSSDSAWTRRFPGDAPSASALTTVQRQKNSRQTWRLMNIDLYAHTHTRDHSGGWWGARGLLDYSQRKQLKKALCTFFLMRISIQKRVRGVMSYIKNEHVGQWHIYIFFYITLDEVRGKKGHEGEGRMMCCEGFQAWIKMELWR